ncbi:MAG: MarR family transcriptional regulator [Ilumatobacteraceae bacterium]
MIELYDEVYFDVKLFAAESPDYDPRRVRRCRRDRFLHRPMGARTARPVLRRDGDDRPARPIRRTRRARIDETLETHDLRVPEFDVLASLRRLGSPYVATPSELTRMLMLARRHDGALDRLERAGYVERRSDPTDRRSVRAVLTAAGFDLIDAAVADHLATEERLLGDLDARERVALDAALRSLVRQFE